MKIGYYVHHHGSGHLERAVSIAAMAPDTFTLIGTHLQEKIANIAFCQLEDDADYKPKATQMPPLGMHYAPYYNPGMRRRMAQIAAWIDKNSPDLLVVDVSTEIALMARLCGIPYVYVRLSGDRTDMAHTIAFSNAEAVLCPFHESLESHGTPLWIKKKSVYFQGLLRERQSDPVMSDFKHAQKRLLFLIGSGGHTIEHSQLKAMASQLQEWEIFVAGPFCKTVSEKKNLHFLGWVDNVQNYIREASFVVGSAGDGVLTAVIAYNKPFICLPQRRPFKEQITKAQNIKALLPASIYEDWPTDWNQAVKQVYQSKSFLGKLHDPYARRNAAHFLSAVAQRCSDTYRADKRRLTHGM